MSSSSRAGILAVSATLTGLSLAAVSLRFYARRQQKAELLIDDWIVLPALATFVGAAICIFTMVHYKDLGYSTQDFTTAQIAGMAELSAKYQIAFDILHNACLACIKISALSFYRRIFCVDRRNEWFNVATKVSIVIVILWLVTFDFLAGFQCGTHFSALWDGTFVQYCTISFPFLYGLVVSDFILDVWTLALPIPRITRLKIQTSKKLSIIGIFLLAFVGLGASIVRMVTLIHQEKAGTAYYINHDQERDLTRYFYLCMLEAGMSLIAVNIPSLWVLLSTAIPRKIARGVRSLTSLLSQSGSGTVNRARQTADRSDSGDSSHSNVPSRPSRLLYQKGPLHTQKDLERQKDSSHTAYGGESKEDEGGVTTSNILRGKAKDHRIAEARDTGS